MSASTLWKLRMIREYGVATLAGMSRPRIIAECPDVDTGATIGEDVAKRLREAAILLSVAKDSGWRDAPAQERIAREPKVEVHGEGDNLVVDVQSGTVRTLEELLAVADVDLDTWRVTKWKANKWDQASKGPKGETRTVELWQVKADFERRAHDGVTGVVEPVAQIAAPDLLTVGDNLEIAVVIPDAQVGHRWTADHSGLIPMHDRAAMDVALQIAEIVSPDYIVNLGDVLDLAPWSRHRRPMDVRDTTTPQLREAHWWLAQFSAIVARTGGEHHLLEGNHEARITKTLTDQLPEATTTIAVGDDTGIASVARLLALDALNIEYHGPYGKRLYLWDSVEFTHGDIARGNGGKTVNAIASKTSHSVWFGHIHTIEQAFRTVWSPDGARVVSTSTPGCLCRTDNTVPGYEGRREWQQGVGIVAYDKSTGQEYSTIIPIIDGAAIYNSVKIEARDRLEEIAEFVGYRQILNEGP